MNRCPITYHPCENRYSEEGLKRLSPHLAALHDFPYTAKALPAPEGRKRKIDRSSLVDYFGRELSGRFRGTPQNDKEWNGYPE